jgi:hypothetical protein
MILLVGIASEPSMTRVLRELQRSGAPYVMLSQRRLVDGDMQLRVIDGFARAILTFEGQRLHLEDVSAVYIRLMDPQFLPELRHEPKESPRREHIRALHAALITWCDFTEARVLNRPRAMSSNLSKGYQLQCLQRAGFLVPETLITNDPDRVREFRERHGQIIYKSVSCVRSIVQLLRDDDLPRLDAIRWCPTQFQRYVSGDNVRVHVVGTHAYATRIRSEAIDYRYATRQGTTARFSRERLSRDVASRCVDLARLLGLEVAGIDLKIAADGGVYCFEVNPSPVFSFYEQHTRQPIARAIARHLSAAQVDVQPGEAT